MLRLVNQLLDFRKIQNKKMKVLVEKTELVSQLQKIMESFHLIAKEKRIDFQLQTNTACDELAKKIKECVIHVKYQ